MGQSGQKAGPLDRRKEAGGTEKEKHSFFEQVIAPHPEQFWLDGCEAPCVRGTVISFKLKPGAKPQRRETTDDFRTVQDFFQNVGPTCSSLSKRASATSLTTWLRVCMPPSQQIQSKGG